MAVKRRFIAGARCPECEQLDRVQRCEEGDRVWMECVACGMQKHPDEPEPGSDHDPAFFRGAGE